MMSLQPGSVRCLHPADFWRNKFHDRLFLASGLDDCLKQLRIGAVSDQDSELSTLEPFRAALHDTECRRRIEVLTGGQRRFCWFWHRLEPQLFCHRGCEGFVDVE